MVGIGFVVIGFFFFTTLVFGLGVPVLGSLFSSPGRMPPLTGGLVLGIGFVVTGLPVPGVGGTLGAGEGLAGIRLFTLLSLLVIRVLGCAPS